MTNDEIYNELVSIENYAKILAQRAAKLRNKLPGGSPSGNQKKKGLTDEQRAEVIANKHKRMNLVSR